MKMLYLGILLRVTRKDSFGSGGYLINTEVNAGDGASVVPFIGFGGSQGTISP